MSSVYHATSQRATQLPLFTFTKICKQCGIEKSLDDFHKHQGTADRRRPICKECRKASNQPTAIVSPSLTKVCATCGAEKSLDDFTPQVDGKYGRTAHCKECVNDKAKAERAAKYATEHANDPIPRSGHKFCITCKGEKPFDAFYEGRNECKVCRRTYSTENKIRRKDTPEFKSWLQEYYSRPGYKERNRANVYRWQRTERGREMHNAAIRRHNKSSKRQEFDRKRRDSPEYQQYHHDYAQWYAHAYPEKVNENRMRRIARQKNATIGKVDYKAILEQYGHVCHICSQDIDPKLRRGRGKLHFDHVIPLKPRAGNPQGTHSMDNIKPSHQCCNNRKNNKRMEDLTEYDRRGPNC